MEKTKKIENVLCTLFILVFVMYVISIIIINTKGLHLFFDSDMYADLVLSKYMWEQKTLFPDGWVFGNQYYIVSTPVLMALLNGVFNNAFISLRVATFIMMILIFVSFIWMVKPFANKLSICVGLLMIVASQIGCEIGKQLEGQLFYLGASYYAIYLITLLIVGGCFIRLINNIKCSKCIHLISLLLSFGCGMQSLRQTAIMVLPLLICCFLYKKKNALYYSFSMLFSNIVGVILIKIINPKNVVTYGGSSITKPSEWLSRLSNCIDSLKKISGLRWLFKGNPVGLVSLLFICIVIISAVVAIVNRKVDFNKLPSLILLFSLGILITIAACIFTSTNIRYVYLFVWFPLVSICATYLLNITSIKENTYLLVIISFSIILSSVFNLYMSYGAEIFDSFKDKETLEKQIGKYVNGCECKYVYGSWARLGNTMSYIDDDIIGGSFYSDEPFTIVNYLNPQNIYSENDNKSAIYILFDYEIEKAYSFADNKGIILNKLIEFNNGEVQLFTADKQLMHFDK